jgi:hypothetical protein
MARRRVAVAAFEALRGVAVLGVAASIVALGAAVAVSFSVADTSCYFGDRTQLDRSCDQQRQAWLAVAAALAALGALGLFLFVAVVVAAGGPRRRGRRWGDRHRPGLLQARGWLADGRLLPADFERVAAGFRRHERGEGEGELMRASGGCLVAVAVPALLGAGLFALLQAATGGHEAVLAATLGSIAALLGAAGVALLLAGIPLYTAGARVSARAHADLEAAMDALARQAHEAAAAAAPAAPARAPRRARAAPQ